jgi:hypothetical protein
MAMISYNRADRTEPLGGFPSAHLVQVIWLPLVLNLVLSPDLLTLPSWVGGRLQTYPGPSRNAEVHGSTTWNTTSSVGMLFSCSLLYPKPPFTASFSQKSPRSPLPHLMPPS